MGKKILFSVSIILILSSVGIFFLFNDFIEKAEKKDTVNDVVVEENQELDDEKNVEKEQETETSEIIDEIEENTGVLMSIPKCTKKGIYLCTKRGMKLYT